MSDDHWIENRCDGCDKPIHPNAGAFCVRCALTFLPPDPFLVGDPNDDDPLDVPERETTLNRAIRLNAERRGA